MCVNLLFLLSLIEMYVVNLLWQGAILEWLEELLIEVLHGGHVAWQEQNKNVLH